MRPEAVVVVDCVPAIDRVVEPVRETDVDWFTDPAPAATAAK